MILSHTLQQNKQNNRFKLLPLHFTETKHFNNPKTHCKVLTGVSPKTELMFHSLANKSNNRLVTIKTHIQLSHINKTVPSEMDIGLFTLIIGMFGAHC